MFGQYKEPGIPKETQSAVDKLKAQAAELIAKALTREPRLTADEKAEIATLQKRLFYLRPVNAKLESLMTAKDERLTFLECNAQTMIIEDGASVDVLTAELALLKPALKLLSEAYRSSSMESGMAESRIMGIKSAAREREINQEAQNGQ